MPKNDRPPDDATLVLAVGGQLDAETGQALLRDLRQAVNQPQERVEIDLEHLDDFTPAGIRALAACRSYMGRFPGGVHVRTRGDTSRKAYLAAFA